MNMINQKSRCAVSKSKPGKVDFNLLVVFEAVWRERHIGRASERLALSQPATSHALARLRKLLGDPLFERVPKGVKPTLVAEALWPKVSIALAGARSVVSYSPELMNLDRRIVIGITNNVALPILPKLLSKIRSVAPDLDISLRPVEPNLAAEHLALGKVDCIIGLWKAEVSKRFIRTKLYDDEYVLVAGKDNLLINTELDISVEVFANLPQVLISPSGNTYGLVDPVLDQLNLSRRVMLVVSDYYLAAEAIASSDLVGVMSRRSATSLASRLPIVIRPLPLKINALRVDLVVPRTSEKISGWLTNLICELL